MLVHTACKENQTKIHEGQTTQMTITSYKTHESICQNNTNADFPGFCAINRDLIISNGILNAAAVNPCETYDGDLERSVRYNNYLIHHISHTTTIVVAQETYSNAR